MSDIELIAKIREPCDCGSQIRHNNGGNYHERIEILKHTSNVGITKYYRLDGDTREIFDNDKQFLVDDGRKLWTTYFNTVNEANRYEEDTGYNLTSLKDDEKLDFIAKCEIDWIISEFEDLEYDIDDFRNQTPNYDTDIEFVEAQ